MRDSGGGAPDPALVTMFRAMRSDARSDPQEPELAQAFPINFGFDGGTSSPTVGGTFILPLGNLRARITDAVIVANGIGSATIDLQIATLADMPVTRPLYGGTIPTLLLAAVSLLDITDWTVNLHPNDVLVGTLKTLTSVAVPPAVGGLTSITLSLYCRRLKWAAGSQIAVDGTGQIVVDSLGNVATGRN